MRTERKQLIRDLNIPCIYTDSQGVKRKVEYIKVMEYYAPERIKMPGIRYYLYYDGHWESCYSMTVDEFIRYRRIVSPLSQDWDEINHIYEWLELFME